MLFRLLELSAQVRWREGGGGSLLKEIEFNRKKKPQLLNKSAQILYCTAALQYVEESFAHVLIYIYMKRWICETYDKQRAIFEINDDWQQTNSIIYLHVLLDSQTAIYHWI